MKTLSFLAVLFLITILYSCGPTPEEAAEYNHKVVKLQKEVINNANILEKEFKSYDSIKIQNALHTAKEKTKKSLETLRTKIQYFDGDTLLYNAMARFIITYMNTYNNEYQKMYKIYCIPAKNYNNTYETQFNDIQNNKNIILKTAYEKLILTQYQFSDKYLVSLKNYKTKKNEY